MAYQRRKKMNKGEFHEVQKHLEAGLYLVEFRVFEDVANYRALVEVYDSRVASFDGTEPLEDDQIRYAKAWKLNGVNGVDSDLPFQLNGRAIDLLSYLTDLNERAA